MKNRRTKGWTAWVGGGSLAMGLLAVLSLGATVFVAERALSEASNVIVRGEGDVLLAAIAVDLADEASPPTTAVLEQELRIHQAKGAKHIAIVDRGGDIRAEAGSATMSDLELRPGPPAARGSRIRIAGPFGMHRGGPEGRFGGAHDFRGPPALLVVEFEPPVVGTLRADLTRISVVAAIAGVVLLAFAAAWSRSARRLASIEERAARDERLVALGSMSSVMAHELRNPLASLKGHAQLLAEDLDDETHEKQRKKAERVVAEAERLEVLTTDLLDFVRDGPIERTSLTIAELVDGALDHLEKDRVEVGLSNASGRVSVDALRVTRALHNLIDNALQASPGGEKVALGVVRAGGETRVTVRDRGPGIPAGSESQIFEPFITTRVRGTGLGLAVARRIAEQHGGTITGENHPDGGALFTMVLPDGTEESR